MLIFCADFKLANYYFSYILSILSSENS